MRYAKRRSVIFSVIITLCFVLSFLSAAKALADKPDEIAASPLEYLLELGGTASDGNDYGGVLSIDGRPIAAEIESAEGEVKFCGIKGYTHIVGSPSGGLIYECRNILLANDHKSNRLARQGNSIVATLHSAGMRSAQEQLAEYDGGENASMCVVLRDGAVLVAAGNNVYSPEAFFSPDDDDYKDLYIDYTAENSNSSKGSTFKPLTLRMLLLEDDSLDEEYSLYNKTFKDYNKVTVNGDTISNWDYDIASNYTTDEGGGVYSRELDLSQAIQLSANTYVLRHAEKLGLENTYNKMNELYCLDKTLCTEINKLSMNEVSPERLCYLPWGQEAYLSSVELCALYNYVFGGDYNIPFYCARVVRPNGEVIYNAAPKPLADKSFSIDPREDILSSALADAFKSYLTEEQQDKFSELVSSRRILAKSGTADLADEAVNRVMVLTVLNEDRTQVVCTACMCIDHTFDYGISNGYMIEKIINVLESMEII